MARMLVLYKTPTDVAVFDKHYNAIHVPLAKALPGLKKFEMSSGPVMTPAGPSGLHMVVTLHFDSMDAIGAALSSPEGQAAATDAQLVATGGLEMLLFDDHVS